jgi:hypothetical protein
VAKRQSKTRSEKSAATVGYEAQLWQMADALRGSMDAAEYKHVGRNAPPGLRRSLSKYTLRIE